MTVILPPEQRRTDEEVDRLLESFFRSEMPDPWPPLHLPVSGRAPQPVRGTWLRRFGRLALAASIALFLAGYMTLASFFPKESNKFEFDPHRTIGKTPGPGTVPKKIDPVKTPILKPLTNPGK